LSYKVLINEVVTAGSIPFSPKASFSATASCPMSRGCPGNLRVSSFSLVLDPE